MRGGRVEQAQRAAKKLLFRKPQYPASIELAHQVVAAAEGKHESGGFLALFKKQHRRATIFASAPRFLQDLGTYGIGIFIPTILAMTIGGKWSTSAVSAISLQMGLLRLREPLSSPDCLSSG
jgi:MFS transporter, putative metabolite transport protein